MIHNLAKPENGEIPRLLYIVHHGYPWSSDGYAVRTQGVARGLMDNGWDVLVAIQPNANDPRNPASPLKPGLFSYDHEGVPYEHTLEPKLQGLSHTESHDCLSAIYQEKIRKFKPRAVMAASNWQVAQPAMDAARREGLPFFYEVRGFWELSQLSRDPDYAKSSEFACNVAEDMRACLQADAVFTLGETMRSELVRRGVPRKKIALVPNGVFVRQAQRPGQAVTKAELGICSELVLGYVGSFNGYEGLDDLLRAAAELHRKGLDLSLLLVGGSEIAGTVASGGEAICPLAHALRSLAEELGFSDRLFMPGRVSAERTAGFYDLINLVVIPRKSTEVTEIVPPLKPLEALAAGKRVLMSNVAPLKELAAKEAGLHCFEKGNLESLGQQIEKLLTSKRLESKKCGIAPLSRSSWSELVRPILSVRHCPPWQYPNRTEQIAAECHSRDTQYYLPAPWATMIDARSSSQWPGEYDTSQLRKFPKLKRLHTVCQHVYWSEVAEDWADRGVTDVWLSHAAESGVRSGRVEPRGLPRIHAWPLYAVNIEDPDRRRGLVIGKNPLSRRYLASFIGAHMDHYISESRLKLQVHAKNPSFYLKDTGKQWHFHGVTWEHQIKGKRLDRVYRVDDSVEEYNHALSESVFALCPAGAGRNTIRLWEAMAVGSIPVLVDEPPLFPTGGSLPMIDWSQIVIQLTPEDIPDLPLILRRIPRDQILDRHHRAMEAYQHVRRMRCF